jgi:hypothetical protein
VNTPNTCFVLGAGASVPYGYPLGNDLAEKIIRLGLDGSTPWPRFWAPTPPILEQTRAWAKKMAERFRSYRMKTPNGTIDAFLHHEYPNAELRQISGDPEWEEYSHAKMLAAEVLLAAEKIDLAIGPRPECGYRLFYELLVRMDQSAWPRIITFNYDRSLEYWLSWYRARDAGCTPTVARGWFAPLQIHHVYQLLAKLPDGQSHDKFSPEYGQWENLNTGDSPFWKGREKMVMLRDPHANKLTEGYEMCQLWLREADRLIVLGFGYDEVNCKRIGLVQPLRNKEVFSTAFGENDAALISERLRPCALKLGMPRESCFDFLRRLKLLEI